MLLNDKKIDLLFMLLVSMFLMGLTAMDVGDYINDQPFRDAFGIFGLIQSYFGNVGVIAVDLIIVLIWLYYFYRKHSKGKLRATSKNT
jgi:hypothetical protein